MTTRVFANYARFFVAVNTGVYREAFTPDQPFIHAPLNRRLEHEPK